ncbi:MAG: DUF5312 family protein [Treponema sp.]|jgi:hypothetical protein|nr:DUF5312 family protein [Treponema sp.]
MADNLLNKALNFIGRGDNAEGNSDKQVLLKQIAKEIAQNKYGKFLRPKSEDMDPSFALYLFTIYRVVHPAQVFLKDGSKIPRIKQIIMESFLDRTAMEIARQISAESIGERRKTTAAKDLPAQLEADLTNLAAAFDQSRYAEADKCYNLITALTRFALFDFTALLRKFDPDLQEGNFTNPPHFSAIPGDSILKELADFRALTAVLEPQDDWRTVLAILKGVKNGSDLIPPDQWNNLLINLRDLKQSNILDMMIRFLSKNPIWEGKTLFPNEQMTSTWLEEKQQEVRGFISAIAEGQRNAQMTALVKVIFGDADIRRLAYYTEEQGKILTGKGLETYIYAGGLNYLLAFIQDYLEKEIRELCDALLIRGQWTDNAASIQMSENFHSAIDITPEIIALDETLSEEGTNGPRLRGAVLRVERDKTQGRYINSIVDGINDEALALITRIVPSLIIVGRHMKNLLEDSQKKYPELIINWKELGFMSKTPISQRIGEAYKKINYFVQLMVLVTRPAE